MPFAAIFQLSSLDGTNGFTMPGGIGNLGLYVGTVSGTGDVNGDGKADCQTALQGGDFTADAAGWLL